MSKPTKQSRWILLLFYTLNLRFPSTLRRVCSPFYSFQSLWHWIAQTTAKWENDYTGRKKDQNQSGSGSFSCVPEELGNFLVLLPRWLEAQPAGAMGGIWDRGRGGAGIGWHLGYWTGDVDGSNAVHFTQHLCKFMCFCLWSLQNNCTNHPVISNICYAQFFTQYCVVDFCILLSVINNLAFLFLAEKCILQKPNGSVFYFGFKSTIIRETITNQCNYVQNIKK